MEEKHINKKITFSIVAVLLIVLVTIGATYAYFSAQAQTDLQTVTTGTLTMGFTNGDIVNATGIVPIADSEIKTKATALPFSITNTGNQHMNITIKLTDITIDDALKDIDFRWGLYNADTDVGISFGIFKYSETNGEEIIYRDSIIDAGADTKNYVLRIWIHDNSKLQNYLQGKTFSAKVTVTGEAIEYTPESCFVFDSNTGTINGYDGYWDNSTSDYLDLGNCPTDVVIPRTINNVSVTKIGYGAFGPAKGGSFAIDSIVIPESVTSIDGGAFADSNLEHITIPENVTSISGEETFYSNDLKTITIPESISSITTDENISQMFGDNQLSFIVIPGNVKRIGLSFMSYNNKLNNVVLMDGIGRIDGWSFESQNLTNLEIPNSVTYIDSAAFQNNQLTNLTLSNNVTYIGDFAFQNNKLTNIEIPNKVIYIGEDAFSGNQLTNVVIPSSVMCIGNNAFGNSTNLSVTVRGKSSIDDFICPDEYPDFVYSDYLSSLNITFRP